MRVVLHKDKLSGTVAPKAELEGQFDQFERNLVDNRAVTGTPVSLV